MRCAGQTGTVSNHSATNSHRNLPSDFAKNSRSPKNVRTRFGARNCTGSGAGRNGNPERGLNADHEK